MSRPNTELKTEIMSQLEKRVDELLAGRKSDDEITLSEIEETVLRIRHQMGEDIAQTLSSVEEQHEASCEVCGAQAINKGAKPKQVVTQGGTLELQRRYFYCPTCCQGFFPLG